MQTSSLALLGGGAVAVAVGAAVYLRPLPQDSSVEATQPEAVVVEEDVAAVELAVAPQNSPDPDGVVSAQSEIEDVSEPLAEVAQEAPIVEAPAQDVEEQQESEPEELVADAVEVAEPQEVDQPEDVIVQEEPADPVPESAPEPIAPVLTEFRFEPDGAVLVSGKAEAGTTVAIMIDGVEIDKLDAGGDGAFFYVGFLGFSDAPRVLSVIADPDGIRLQSDRTFVMAANPEPVVVAVAEPDVETPPSEAPAEQPEPVNLDATEEDQPASVLAPVLTTEDEPKDESPVVAQAQVQDPIAVETSVVESSANTETETPPAIATVADPVSPTVLSVTEDGVDVVSAPVADTSPEVMSTVALDAITYDPEGEVVLQGRALGEGFVQVYVDNAPISRLPVDADGTWRGDLPDVDKGVYTLRIDEVDVEGEVVSRIETPFLREDPETVAAALAEEVEDPEFSVATRTVQPGATLWAIAEERYGEGVLYVTVFEANRDRIRDPDLIYPGQVFVLPEDNE